MKTIVNVSLMAVVGFALSYCIQLFISSEEKLTSPISSNNEGPRFERKKSLTIHSIKKKNYRSIDDLFSHTQSNKKMVELCDYILSLKEEQIIREISLQNKPFVLKMLFDRLAELHPEKAMELSFHLIRDERNVNIPIIRSTFKVWAKNNLTAAEAYAERAKTKFPSIPFDSIILDRKLIENTQTILGSIASSPIHKLNPFESLARQQSPSKTMELIQDIPMENALKIQLITAIAQEWTNKDWSATEQWLNTLPSHLQEYARCAVMTTHDDPWTATKIITTSDFIKPNEEKLQVLRQFTHRLAIDNPHKAKEWILLHAPKENPIGMDQIVKTICINDTETAKSLIQELPDSETKDAAIKNLIAYTPSLPPKESLDYLITLKKEKEPFAIRQKIYATLAKWAQKDEIAVKEWIQQAPLSKEQKEDFLSIIARKNTSYGTTNIGN